MRKEIQYFPSFMTPCTVRLAMPALLHTRCAVEEDARKSGA